MQTYEQIALSFTGECEPASLGICANHKAPLGGATTCLHVLHLSELIRARDEAIRADERAKVQAELTEVYALAWDGEPSMSGEPHRVSTGAELSEPDARRALATVGRRKPNARVERRLVGPWEPTEEITQPKEQKP